MRPDRTFAVMAILLTAQGGLVVATLAATLLPGTQGTTLIIPLRGGSIGATINRFVSDNVRLVGAGALPGSIIVSGDRHEIRDNEAGSATLMIPVSASLCGGDGRTSLQGSTS